MHAARHAPGPLRIEDTFIKAWSGASYTALGFAAHAVLHEVPARIPQTQAIVKEIPP